MELMPVIIAFLKAAAHVISVLIAYLALSMGYAIFLGRKEEKIARNLDLEIARTFDITVEDIDELEQDSETFRRIVKSITHDYSRKFFRNRLNDSLGVIEYALNVTANVVLLLLVIALFGYMFIEATLAPAFLLWLAIPIQLAVILINTILDGVSNLITGSPDGGAQRMREAANGLLSGELEMPKRTLTLRQRRELDTDLLH